MFDLNKMGFGASSNTWSLESLSLDYSSDVVDFGLESFEYNTGLESLSIATEGIFQTIKDAIVRFFKWIGEKLGLIKKQSSSVVEKAEKVVKQTEDVEKKAEDAKKATEEVAKDPSIDKDTPIVTDAELSKEDKSTSADNKESKEVEKSADEEKKPEDKKESSEPVNKPEMTQFKTNGDKERSHLDKAKDLVKSLTKHKTKKYTKIELIYRMDHLTRLNDQQLKSISELFSNINKDEREHGIIMGDIFTVLHDATHYIGLSDIHIKKVFEFLKKYDANTDEKDIAVYIEDSFKDIGVRLEILTKKFAELEQKISKTKNSRSVEDINTLLKPFMKTTKDIKSIRRAKKNLTFDKMRTTLDVIENKINIGSGIKPGSHVNVTLFKTNQNKLEDFIENREVNELIKVFEEYEKNISADDRFNKDNESIQMMIEATKNSQKILSNILKFNSEAINIFKRDIEVINAANIIRNDIADLRFALVEVGVFNKGDKAWEDFPGLEDLNYKVDLYKRMVTKGYSVELAMESMAVTHNLVVPNYYEYQIATEGIFESIKNAFRRFFEWLKEKLGFSKSKAEDIKSKTEEVKEEIKKSEENAEKSEKVAKAAEEVIKEAKDSQDPNKPRYDEKRYEYLSNKFDDELKKIYGETGNKFSVGKNSKAILGKMDYLSKISKSELEKVGKELGEVFKAEANRFNYLEQIQHTIEDKYPAWVRKLNIFIEKGKESKLEDSDSDFLRFEGNLHDDENKTKDKVSSVEQSLKPLLGGTSEEGITYNPNESFGYVIIRIKDTIHSAMGFNSQGIYELIEKRYAFEEKRNEVINKTIKTDDLTKLLDDTLKSLESDKEKSKETIDLFKKFQTDLMNLIKMHNRLQSDYVNFLKVVSLYFKFSNYMGNLSVEYQMARFHEEILKKKGNPDETIEF